MILLAPYLSPLNSPATAQVAPLRDRSRLASGCCAGSEAGEMPGQPPSCSSAQGCLSTQTFLMLKVAPTSCMLQETLTKLPVATTLLSPISACLIGPLPGLRMKEKAISVWDLGSDTDPLSLSPPSPSLFLSPPVHPLPPSPFISPSRSPGPLASSPSYLGQQSVWAGVLEAGKRTQESCGRRGVRKTSDSGIGKY